MSQHAEAPYLSASTIREAAAYVQPVAHVHLINGKYHMPSINLRANLRLSGRSGGGECALHPPPLQERSTGSRQWGKSAKAIM